ncbi:LTA synthase family protein [Pedobacter sp. P351]|uniref:LTA synthase family protein n=1 Tax=Pedobacter superstes TaxID=3133441 RepID=UPI0030B14C40
MIKNLFTVFRYFAFWLLFFFLERLLFILAFTEKVKGTPITEIGKSFIVGLWMDASMAAYISVIPLLLTLLVWFIPAVKIPSGILRWYTAVLIVVFSIICAFNFNIYREWGSKINYKALDFAFNSPNEAVASSASSPVFASLSTLLLLILLSLWLSKKIIRYQSLQKVNIQLKIIASALLIGFNFLAIRGGWQLSPMNESMAYYSNVPVLNHATVNTEWSLFRDILNNKSTKNPYPYYTKSESAKIVSELLKKPETSGTEVLTSKRPNVVLIILESFTADVVESLGGEKGVSPQMKKLAEEGMLFENIYASGDRTDKGVVAILNAFPSQAIRSVMKLNSKQEKLPSMSQVFIKNGYSTSFFYGGESEFFNMKSYLLSHSYQEIIDKSSFNKKDMNSKWGAFDDLVFSKLLSKARSAKQPFFSTVLTLTNHEPFEVPGTPHFKGEEVENKFRSTAYYTDSCLGALINKAKKEQWYKNTLFIALADHGHRLPKNQSEIYHPNRFRIPLLFFGEVIKPEFRGKRISKIGSQTDLAATLFNQLQMPSGDFKWSRDILNPGTRDFAFFDWDNGFGVATSEQVISFDNTGKNIVYKNIPNNNKKDAALLYYGKAYMQSVFQDYLDY